MQPTMTTLFRDELSPGERILWTGQPRQGLLLRPADAFLIPFSLLWGGFAFFWEATALMSGGPFFMTLWGIPFVLVGIYFILGRFFVDAWQRQNTYYALTSERAIIQSGLFTRSTRSLNLKTLSEVSLTRQNDGRGTITFGPIHPFGWWYTGFQGWPGMDRMTPPTFEQIEDARRVYDLLRQAQKEV